ncbi:MAG: NfeD family protein [Saccharofermentanales bacterium]|jgi:membrane protein implicated in regulation of membrane protease activity
MPLMILSGAAILGVQDVLFWGIILAISAIAEIATMNLVSIWFVVGALVALVVGLLGGSVALQFIFFAVLSVAGFLLFVLVIKKRRNVREITPTNADRILHKEGVVTETIDALTGRGQIKVAGQVWSARMDAEEGTIPKGTRVRVIGLVGVKAVVQPMTDAPPPAC